MGRPNPELPVQRGVVDTHCHLFLVDQKETRYIDCSGQALPYGEQLISDILNRTETAMSQAHCFLATELVLKAQHQAQRLNIKA